MPLAFAVPVIGSAVAPELFPNGTRAEGRAVAFDVDGDDVASPVFGLNEDALPVAPAPGLIVDIAVGEEAEVPDADVCANKAGTTLATIFSYAAWIFSRYWFDSSFRSSAFRPAEFDTRNDE